MKLFVNPWSGNCRKVIMAAYETGIEPELVAIDLPKGEHRKPEFMAMNPNGKVPVMVDGDFTLWESNAIVKYIAWKNMKSGLWPESLQDKADQERWMSWQLAHWNPALSTLVFERVVKGMLGLGDPDPAKVEEGLAQTQVVLEILNGHLEGRQWVAGDRVTCADIALCPMLFFTQPAGIPIGDYPNVNGWSERIQALDSWKRSLPKT